MIKATTKKGHARMAKYRVTYFYLATGMEGCADERNYGLISAPNQAAAIEAVVTAEYPEDVMYGPSKAYSSRAFLRSCLSAKEVHITETGG